MQSHTYPDGSTQSYGYQSGRLAKVTLPNNSEISYGNYTWMVPGQISTPGATKTLGYDALQRPLSIEVKNTPASGTAQILMSRLYQYDQAGNITQIKSDLGTTDYGYDRLSRLTQATPDQNLQTLGQPNEQYGYDAVHNRTSSGHQPGAWAYNGDNQLTHYPYLRPFTPGSTPADTQVSYTPQGHTSKETSAQWEKHYQYSAAERLIRYATTNQGQGSPALEANYRYDPFGRRIAKSVKEASTATTYFVYGEQGLMAEADEQGKLQTAYGFNPMAASQGLWSTDPIWQANVNNGSLTAQDTSFHYLHTDHLGTPQLATTKEGQTSWKAQSEAFGAAGVLQSQSSITMNLRFPGQYFDQETGSHYNFHRDYKSNQGRYIESDPIGLEGGINFFAYVSAKPLVARDSLGLQREMCAAGLSAWCPPPPPPPPCNCTDPPAPPGNGCGGNGSDFKPDEFNPFENIFEGCCNGHDECYGTCSGPSKVSCDVSFLECMMGECRKKIKNGYSVAITCSFVASAYYQGVSQGGWMFFDRSHCCEGR